MKTLVTRCSLVLSLIFFSTLFAHAQDCFDAGDCWLQAGQKGNTQEAITFYDKAEAMWNSDNDSSMLYHIHSGRGNVYNALKDYTKALQDFNKLIQMKPKDNKILSVAYTSRGNIMRSNGNTAGAIASYTKSIETYPPNMIALSNRCYVYFDLDQKDMAMEDLKKWADLGSNRALEILQSEFQINYSEQQKAALAKDTQWQAIEKERLKAVGLKNEKKYQEAYELYIKVFDLFGERKDAESQAVIGTEMANIQNKMGDYFRALTWASQAAYGAHGNNLSYIELAKAHYGQGNIDAARNACDQGLKKYKGSPSISDYAYTISLEVANNAYTDADYATAYSFYQAAYYYNNSDAQAIKYAGYSAYNVKSFKDALNCFETAVKGNSSYQTELKPYIDYCRSVVK